MGKAKSPDITEARERKQFKTGVWLLRASGDGEERGLILNLKQMRINIVILTVGSIE